LVQAADGNFYGTTSGGGLNGTGTIFKISPAGMLTMLDSFGPPQGFVPNGGLIQATNGDLHGQLAKNSHEPTHREPDCCQSVVRGAVWSFTRNFKH